MYQLTIKKDSIEHSYTYDLHKMIVGSKKGAPVELTLDEPEIEPILFSIVANHGNYAIENLANDPKLRVNGSPFWKKDLNDGDQIQIASTTIHFALLKEAPQDKSTSFTTTGFKKASDISTEGNPLENKPSPAYTEFESPPAAEPGKIGIFLKEIGTKVIEKLKTERYESAWHVWLLFMGVLATFTVLFSISFYLTISERSDKQRMIAARGLADIAMSLSYAKMHQIKPPQTNWLDPDFLKEVSKNIFPDTVTQRNWIDQGGEFVETPYLLRIYSDPLFDRFLLIAQPRHTFLQWLIPNDTLVIDSQEMIMKHLNNIKELNRLLVSTSGFEGINQQEIVKVVEQAAPVPLSMMAKEREGLGFHTPQELELLNPNLELYVYNAPRYYLWNQLLIERAHELNYTANNPKQFEWVAKAIDIRAPFKHMVLYTSKGIEPAIDARRVITENWPNNTFLIGHLDLSKTGRIEESHLLMKSHKLFSNNLPEKNSSQNTALTTLPLEIAALTKNPLTALIGQKPKKGSSKIIINGRESRGLLHPLYIELNTLLEERELRLLQYYEPIAQLLYDHLKKSDRQFFIHYKNAYSAFEEALRNEQIILDEKINALHEKRVIKAKTLSLQQILTIIDQKGIDMGYEEDTYFLTHPSFANHSMEDQLKTLFDMIHATKNIHVLDQAVAAVNNLLTQTNIPDLQTLGIRQGKLRSLVLFKLETMLWNPQVDESDLPMGDELRWIVGRILKNGYISEKEAREFYLSQFLDITEK